MLDRERFPLVLLFVTILFAACLMPAQSDTWWQLRAGESMWQSGHVMLHDEFTHTVAGQRWPNHEWLSEVLFFGAYQMGGMPLLTLLCALAVTLAWVIVISLTPGAPLLRVAMAGAGAIMTADGWTLRPQVLTLALFAATLWMLVRRRGLWLLPLLFLVWANLHGGVSLGGILLVAAAISLLILRDSDCRRLVAIGCLCFVATGLTPLGWSLWREIPFSLHRLQTYGVLEWQSPGWSEPTDLAFWILGIAALSIMIVKRRALRDRAPLTLAVATVMLFVLASRSARHIPEFVLCAVPTIGTLLWTAHRAPTQPARSRSMVVPNAVLLGLTSAGAVLFVAHAWQTPLPRLQWTPLSDDTLAAIAACNGPLYNRYDEGGYLIWFMKDRKVFIDSRQDPFPEDLVLEHIRVERTGDYHAMFDRYGIACALTPKGSVLAKSLDRDGWTERGADQWAVYSAGQSPVSNSAASRTSSPREAMEDKSRR